MIITALGSVRATRYPTGRVEDRQLKWSRLSEQIFRIDK